MKVPMEAPGFVGVLMEAPGFPSGPWRPPAWRPWKPLEARLSCKHLKEKQEDDLFKALAGSNLVGSL